MTTEKTVNRSGSQTLTRGLDILGVVAMGPAGLDDLTSKLSLSKPTAQRLAKALVDRGFLSVTRQRYHLGRAVLELGSRARAQVDVVRVARPHVVALSRKTDAVIYLARRNGDRAVCIDHVCDNRRSRPLIRVGDTFPIEGSAVGRALCDRGGGCVVEQAKGDAGGTWSLAVPIRDADELVIAALVATDFTRVRRAAGDANLESHLRATAENIGTDCGSFRSGRHEARGIRQQEYVGDKRRDGDREG